MKLTKVLAMLLAALMLVGSFAACGGGPEGSSDVTTDAAPAESGDVT